MHSDARLDRLRRRGSITADCPPAEDPVPGCAEHRGHLVVALGEITRTPPGGPPPSDGGYRVRTVLFVPRFTCVTGEEQRNPSGFYGVWHLLARRPDGRWEIERTLPAFFV